MVFSEAMESRAAILRNVGGPWSVETFELDPPRTGEVLLRMAAADGRPPSRSRSR
jgi:Zn-dependent alcohol dehydrogenase